MNDIETKLRILITVDDVVGDFLFYDRREDEELSADDLEQAIRDEIITVEEIVDRFRTGLIEALG